MALSQLHKGKVTVDRFEHVVPVAEAATQLYRARGPTREQLSYAATASITRKGVTSGKVMHS